VVRVWAPGRVNLIGEHTDYNDGLVLPFAIDLGIEMEVEPQPGGIELSSDLKEVSVSIALPIREPSTVTPRWGRYVGAVAAELGATVGFRGLMRSTLPTGSGLSSSAALEVATALALGAGGPVVEIAALCQRAEQRATGVPCGIMDQLACLAGVPEHALLIDCRDLSITPVPIPEGLAVVAVHSGQERTLGATPYAQRRQQCERAAGIIGPLRDACLEDLSAIADPTLRARARHVISENQRVLDMVAALTDGDLARTGQILSEGHRSLRDDFEVSTPQIDALVDRLVATPGVLGARLTGAGFGGTVVALTEPGVDLGMGWPVRAAGGATRSELD
jgi:galactokinase